jgi:hypothetical protein
MFSHGSLADGSLLTKQFAQELGKSCVYIDLTENFQTLEPAASGHGRIFPNLGKTVYHFCVA